MKGLKKAAAALLCVALAVSAAVPAGAEESAVFTKLASYSVGAQNADGGVAEIVEYNPDNGKMYVVSGATRSLRIVDLAGVQAGSTADLGAGTDINIGDIAQQAEPGFVFGDFTSVAVSTQKKGIVCAVQAAGTADPGMLLVLDYDGGYLAHYMVGVQPDMVALTPDGLTALTADEGEPRDGYGPGVTDPKGSVSIVRLDTGAVTTADFTAFDGAQARAALVADNVLLKKDTNPSVDLEPEYIAVTPDGKTAYVSLQEANAIATVDIEAGSVTAINGLGFKDYSTGDNRIDLQRPDTDKTGWSDEANIIHYDNVYGVYMPDAVATVTAGGKTYLLTANEGDAREWGSGATEYTNLDDTRDMLPGTEDQQKLYKKVDILDVSKMDGFEIDDGSAYYLLGGRSFSVWDTQDMSLVYDSGADFEQLTAENPLTAAWFNCSNDDADKKSRSSKKGPEPEGITTGTIGDRTFAFIGLERVSGVMLYDITDPSAPVYAGYINSRDYSQAIAGDVSPEGLCFVPAEQSPTGGALLLCAHEVSGTVAVYGTAAEQQPVPSVPEEKPQTPEEDPVQPSVPQTGEISRVGGLLTLAVLSVAAGLAVLYKKRKQA